MTWAIPKIIIKKLIIFYSIEFLNIQVNVLYSVRRTWAIYGVTIAPKRAIALQVPTPMDLNGVGYTYTKIM